MINDVQAPPPPPRLTVGCGWALLVTGLVVFALCAVWCAHSARQVWCDGLKACPYTPPSDWPVQTGQRIGFLLSPQRPAHDSPDQVTGWPGGRVTGWPGGRVADVMTTRIAV